jgi:hypothetical protein
MTPQERFPSRRTWERRLQGIPATLPAQSGCLGRHLSELIQPWITSGRSVASEITILRARGGVWHQKHRAQGELPHPSIEPQAHWTTSRWHGWVSGWKLHVVSAVAAVWFPIAAVLTPASIVESEPAPELLREVPAEVRFVLGELHDTTPGLHAHCAQADRVVVTSTYGRSPYPDDGVEVRRVFHKLRSKAMEHVHEHFKGICDEHGQVPDLWPDRDSTLRVWGDFCLSIGFDFPALSTAWNSVSVSKLSSRQPEDL